MYPKLTYFNLLMCLMVKISFMVQVFWETNFIVLLETFRLISYNSEICLGIIVFHFILKTYNDSFDY